MRPENAEALRRYLRNQPKAIAYSERLQADHQNTSDHWVLWVAGLTVLAVFATHGFA